MSKLFPAAVFATLAEIAFFALPMPAHAPVTYPAEAAIFGQPTA